MRRARGNLYDASGIFHLESNLRAGQPSFSPEEAHLYETWTSGLATVFGLELVFWQFHAHGFSVIVETGPRAKTAKSKLSEGLAKIDEFRLSEHVLAPARHKLNQSDARRLERYQKNNRNLMEFGKSLKQRLSRQHNRIHGTRGVIWHDRIGIYPLPDRGHDLTEVAAFILASSHLHGPQRSGNWPGSYASALKEEPVAVSGLKRIFRNNRSTKENLRSLLERSAEVHQAAQNNPSKKEGPGRKPKWRPNCETSEYLESLVTRDDSSRKKRQIARAKEHFLKMLKRFESFKKKTGLKTIPHGWPDDIELRNWANQQRGLYRAQRLPDWKVRQLQGSGLLEPPTTQANNNSGPGNREIHPRWIAHYKELKSYYEQHGHSRITRRDPSQKTLANWIWIQRAKRRNSQLLPEQIKLLDELHFCWNPRGSAK